MTGGRPVRNAPPEDGYERPDSARDRGTFRQLPRKPMKRVLPLAMLSLLLGCSGEDARPAPPAGERSAAVAARDGRAGPVASDSTAVGEAPHGAAIGADDPAPGGGDRAAADGGRAPPSDDDDARDDGGPGLDGSAETDGTSAQTDPYAILDRASEAYEALRSIQADFRQEARNPILRRTVRSSGTLFQRQPDLFLMRFDDPAGDLIVSDGSHVWVYYPSVDSAQVVRLPAARGAGATDLRSQFIGEPRERFRATHRGAETVAGRPADVLLLEPRTEDPGYRSLVVWIDRADGLARRFEITESNGLVRRFELSDLRRNPDLPTGMFRFEPPEGARIVDRG